MLAVVEDQAQAAPGQQQDKAEKVTSFIRVARVKEISGLSKSTLWRWIEGDPANGVPGGRFPAPVIREGNTVLWDLAEVMAWRAEQFKKRAARDG